MLDLPGSIVRATSGRHRQSPEAVEEIAPVINHEDGQRAGLEQLGPLGSVPAGDRPRERERGLQGWHQIARPRPPRRRPPIRLRWRASSRPGRTTPAGLDGQHARVRHDLRSLGDRMADMQCIDGIGPQDPGIRLPDRGIVLRQFNGGIAALNFARAQHLVVQSILLASPRACPPPIGCLACPSPGSRKSAAAFHPSTARARANTRRRAAAMARIADFPSSPGGSPATPRATSRDRAPAGTSFDADDALAAFRELKKRRGAHCARPITATSWIDSCISSPGSLNPSPLRGESQRQAVATWMDRMVRVEFRVEYIRAMVARPARYRRLRRRTNGLAGAPALVTVSRSSKNPRKTGIRPSNPRFEARPSGPWRGTGSSGHILRVKYRGIRRAFPSGRPLASVTHPERCFMVNMNRRQFFKVTGATAGSSLALLGAAPARPWRKSVSTSLRA